MNESTLKKWQALDKYMPFIEFLLELDRRKYIKFKKIKMWITERKNFDAQTIDQIHKSIGIQYKKLYLSRYKIPNHISDLFIKFNETTIEISSDEDEDENEGPEGKDNNSNQNPENQIFKSPDEDVKATAGSRPEIQTTQSFENMDIEELRNIYSLLMEKNGIDLTEYLPDLLEMYYNKQETMSCVPARQDSPAQYVEPNTLPLCNNNAQLIKSITQPYTSPLPPPPPLPLLPLPINEMPIHPTAPQIPNSSVNCGPFQHKLNLKDPRIIKALKGIKNSPLQSLGTRQLAEYLTECIPRWEAPTLANNANQACPTNEAQRPVNITKEPELEISPRNTEATQRNPSRNEQNTLPSGNCNKEPSTYGEYKRMKAAKEKEKLAKSNNVKVVQSAPKGSTKKLNVNPAASNIVNAIDTESTRLTANKEAKNIRSNSTTKPPQEINKVSANHQDESKSKKSSTRDSNKIDDIKLQLISAIQPHCDQLKSLLQGNNNMALVKGGTQNEANQSNSNSIPKKPSKPEIKTNKTDRTLDSLKCTIKGYDSLQDYFPKSINGKRRSSISARSAIAEQLGRNSNRDEQSKTISNPKPIGNRRRSSVSAQSVIRDLLMSSDDEFSTNNSNNQATLIGDKGRSSVCARSANVAKCSEEKSHLDTRKSLTPNRKLPPPSSSSAEGVENNHKKGTKNKNSSTNTKQAQKRRKSMCISKNDEAEYGERSNQSPVPARKSPKKLKMTNVKNVDKIERRKAPALKADEEINLRKKVTIKFKYQPVVKLKRLKEKEILKYTSRVSIPKTTSSAEPRLIQINSRKSILSPNRNSASPPPIKRNTDRTMRENNTSFCALCTVKSGDLTNHYIRIHKTESYISRMDRETLDNLQINIPFAMPLNNNTRCNKYRVKCQFCKDEIIDEFINFHNHFSTHTGEFAFQCSSCKIRKPFRVDIQSHQSHAKTCRNTPIKRLYQYPKDLMVIHLHCCKICNFVQLNQENVFKHLRDHHDKSQRDSTCVESFILAAINSSNEPAHTLAIESVESLQSNDIAVNEDADWEDAFFDHKPKNELIVVNEPCESEISIETKVQPEQVNTIDDAVPMTVVHNPLEPDVKPYEDLLDEQANNPFVSQSGDDLDIDISNSNKNSKTCSSTLSAHESYKSYPENVNYYGLYKCMAVDCYFSSNVKEEMLNHLNDHNTSAYPPSGYLQCAYCTLIMDQITTPDALVTHIQNEHYSSNYQCSKCSYRSRVPCNIVLHAQKQHSIPDTEIIVYECDKSSFPVESGESLSGKLIRLMVTNVKLLNCQYCSFECYAWSSMEVHSKNEHNKKVVKYIYACIYCEKNIYHKSVMQQHLAISHPEELPYACQRILKTGQKVDAVRNLMLCDLSIGVPAAQIMPPPELNKEILATDDILLSPVSDVKPSPAQLCNILLEAIKPLLKKLTAGTGVSPDRLYCCSEPSCGGLFSIYELWRRHIIIRHNSILTKCPHCADELSILEFEDHFDKHLQHTYLCYYCDATFKNEHQLWVHGTISHFDLGDMQLEKIPFNLQYSYFILILKNMSMDALQFYTNLQELLKARWVDKQRKEAEKTLKKWEIPVTSTVLDKYPSYNSDVVEKGKKCFYPNCKEQRQNIDQIFQHIRESHTLKVGVSTYTCYKCQRALPVGKSWDKIERHIQLHGRHMYICCICEFYHYDRQKMSLHAKVEHNKRDVPIITLRRTNFNTCFGIYIVFAAGKRTFTTLRNCFVCDEANLNMENFARHLKRQHHIKLDYACDICYTPLPKLQDSNDHFKKDHPNEALKIRCEIGSKDAIMLDEIKPLRLSMKDNTFKLGERALNHNNNITIKMERPDEGYEINDDLLILEEDDIAIEQDCSTLPMSPPKTVPQIRCANISALMQGDKNNVKLPQNHAVPSQTCASATNAVQQSSSSNNSSILSSYLIPAGTIVKTIQIPRSVQAEVRSSSTTPNMTTSQSNLNGHNSHTNANARQETTQNSSLSTISGTLSLNDSVNTAHPLPTLVPFAHNSTFADSSIIGTPHGYGPDNYRNQQNSTANISHSLQQEYAQNLTTQTNAPSSNIYPSAYNPHNSTSQRMIRPSTIATSSTVLNNVNTLSNTYGQLAPTTTTNTNFCNAYGQHASASQRMVNPPTATSSTGLNNGNNLPNTYGQVAPTTTNTNFCNAYGQHTTASRNPLLKAKLLNKMRPPYANNQSGSFNQNGFIPLQSCAATNDMNNVTLTTHCASTAPTNFTANTTFNQMTANVPNQTQQYSSYSALEQNAHSNPYGQ